MLKPDRRVVCWSGRGWWPLWQCIFVTDENHAIINSDPGTCFEMFVKRAQRGETWRGIPTGDLCLRIPEKSNTATSKFKQPLVHLLTTKKKSCVGSCIKREEQRIKYERGNIRIMEGTSRNMKRGGKESNTCEGQSTS